MFNHMINVHIQVAIQANDVTTNAANDVTTNAANDVTANPAITQAPTITELGSGSTPTTASITEQGSGSTPTTARKY